eukprot:155674_1
MQTCFFTVWVSILWISIVQCNNIGKKQNSQTVPLCMHCANTTDQLLIVTDEARDENGAVSRNNALEEFVSQKLGEMVDIYSKLQNSGVVNIDMLVFIDNDDLKQLCQELGLSFGEKMKFKTEIRKLKEQYGQKRKNTVIMNSCGEQSEIEPIDLALKQFNESQHIFEGYSNEIDDIIANTKTQINTEIDTVIKSLESTKQYLHQKLDEWKLRKLENVNKICANIIEYN